MELNSQPDVRAPIRALLLDDDAFDRRRIRKFTEKSNFAINVQEVPTLSALKDAIASEKFDLIMLDYNLAEGDGLDALAIIQNTSKNKDSAIIMISGQEETSVAVSAFRGGCQDFLNKQELSADSLGAAMQNALQKRETKMYFNPLGAPEFHEAVEVAVAKAMRSETVFAAIAEGFKKIAVQTTSIPMNPSMDELGVFVEDFLNDQDFHFNR